MRYCTETMGIMGALILCAAAIPIAARSDVTIRQITYNGWDSAYEMSNGTVDLVFVPQIGRIMRYGRVNGPNMLWNNAALAGTKADPVEAAKTWPNFGGDKLWPAPQDRWNWPPDPSIDSATQLVQVMANRHLLVFGQPSTKYGIQFTREITLAPKGTDVTIKNTMRNISSSAQEWGLWQITQTDDPAPIHLRRSKSGKFPAGYYNFKNPTPPAGSELTADFLILKRDPNNTFKSGTDSPICELTGEIQDQVFHTSAHYEPGGNYPDQGCTAEVYGNPDPLKYIELELMAPVRKLSPDRSAVFVTYWKITQN